MKKNKILWLSTSSLGMSETFLVDTIDMLKEEFEVRCVSTQPKQQNSLHNLHFSGIGRSTETLLERVIRRLINVDWSHGRSTSRIEIFEKRTTVLLEKELFDWHPELLWFSYGELAAWACEFLSMSDIPYVIEVHGYDVSSLLTKEKYLKRFVKVANSASAVICASFHTRNRCVLAGVEESRISVVRYSLNAQEIRPVGVQKTAEPSFVHFGRLTEKKQPIVTLEAFKLVQQEYRNAKLTIIGEGSMEKRLRNMVVTYGLEKNVNFVGAMERSKALKLVEEHWVFCQHSVTAGNGDQEGFALSPAEAALLELPVVSTYHNGIPEHVVEGETGFLVREYDIQGMAKAMVELSKNEDIRRQFGQSGRKRVTTLCNPEQRKVALVSIVEQALSQD